MKNDKYVQEDKLKQYPDVDKKGLYIVIEGPDGSGKTSVVSELEKIMHRQGLCTTKVRQPGGTPLAEQFRDIVKNGHPDEQLLPLSELYLVLAARTQLNEHVIKPNLADGVHVISDRGDLSTLVYQHSVAEQFFKFIDHNPSHVKADLLVIIDVDYKTVIERIGIRGEVSDRLEANLESKVERYQSVTIKETSAIAKYSSIIPAIAACGHVRTPEEIAWIIYNTISELTD